MIQEIIAKIIFSFVLLILLVITYYIIIITDEKQPRDKKYHPLILLIPIGVAIPLELLGNVFISSYYLGKNIRNGRISNY